MSRNHGDELGPPPEDLDDRDVQLRDNGFIKLNTHDVSFVEEHIPSIEKFAEDLQVAINAAWPTRNRSRYQDAHVLLLSWEDDNLGVDEEISRLGYVFSNLYRFNVDSFKIPRKTPGKATSKRMSAFLEQDSGENLLIVYYAGHARLSHRSNDPPIWSATDKAGSPTLPSGGIQQLLEEAESDVLLLYDSCHSSHPAVNVSGQGVTEVIAACGFETQAPAVGPHSFTNALIRELEESFAGPPISIAELHGRVIGSLKNWKPGLLRDANGNVWTDKNGRPKYECHKRRTPVHCFLTNENPYRSIMLAPLPTKLSHAAVANIEQGLPAPSISPDSTDLSRSAEISDETVSTAPTTVSTSSKGGRAPHVLLAVRLEDDYLFHDTEDNDQRLRKWADWLKAAPEGTDGISIQGVYKSFSTLLLVKVPVVLWDILPDNSAYSFVGFVTSDNLAQELNYGTDLVKADVMNPSDIDCEDDAPTPVGFRQLQLDERASSETEPTTSEFLEGRRTPLAVAKFQVSKEEDIQLLDSIGRSHFFPFHRCTVWTGIESLIKEVFKDVNYHVGNAVFRGQYHLLDEEQNILLPEKWTSTVHPGMSLTMQMWSTPTPINNLTPPPFRATTPSGFLALNRRSKILPHDHVESSITVMVQERPSNPHTPPLERRRTLKRRPGFLLRPQEPTNDAEVPIKIQQHIERPTDISTTNPIKIQTYLTAEESFTKRPPLSRLIVPQDAESSDSKTRPESSGLYKSSRTSYLTSRNSGDYQKYDKLLFLDNPPPSRGLTSRLSQCSTQIGSEVSIDFRRYSGTSEKAIARAVAHKLRKDKRNSLSNESAEEYARTQKRILNEQIAIGVVKQVH